MVKTNVDGAVNVVEAAFDARVPKVVALSSDKACEPLNAYGKSKALAEHIFLAANNVRGANGSRFAVVRYGNVAGSQGSVIPIWRSLIASGTKAVPVTDPEATRFWMTIEEACSFVLWAAENCNSLAVPSLPAFRLRDLAEAMGAELEVVGLGSGEKRHETMISANEAGQFSMHGGYWVKGEGRAILDHALTSDSARRLRVEELAERLANV
jgi:UDP-N-acetylglucosamine 4,6-dehydratase